MYALVKFLVRVYFRIVYNIRFEGRENIPKNTSVIYASNHRSYADPPLVGCAARGKLSFMAKEALSERFRLRGERAIQRLSTLLSKSLNRAGVS